MRTPQMRTRTGQSLFLVFLLTILGSELRAAAFLVPPDEAMIDSADAIFIGNVVSGTPRFDSKGEIVTDVLFRVERVLKGEIGESIIVTVPGGIIGDRGRHVSGAPEYRPGERALVFLEAGLDPPWRTWNLELGKFSFVLSREGQSLLIRGAREGEIFGWDLFGRRHTEPLRDAELFVLYIAARVQGLPVPGDYIVSPARPLPAEPGDSTVGSPGETGEESGEEGSQSTEEDAELVISNAHYPPSAYTMGTFRWDLFDKGGSVAYKISGNQPGYDSSGAAQRATAAWTNDPGSNVRLSIASGAGGGFTRDGTSSIIFNNSTDVPSGAIGYAQVYSQGTHTYKGVTFYTVVEGDVAMRSNLNISQKVFDEAVTHEVGHTIALRHSDTAEPSSNSAVMKSSLTGNYGATLAPWDIEAIGHVYTETATAPDAPTGVVATAVATNRVRITWSAVSGATGYSVQRSEAGGSYVQIATLTGTSYDDTTVQAGRAYLYRVVATTASGSSPPSAPDLATTFIFTDPTLTPGVTVIKAVHLTELRAAVNAVRTLAGLGSASWTDPNPQGVVIKAIHWTELRDRLNEARTALGLPPVSFPTPVTSGAVVQAAHVEAMRAGVR
jgi:hypothetical protein